MILHIYIASELFAVEITSKGTVLFREVCTFDRFTTLMEDLILPETYSITTSLNNISTIMKIGKLKNMTLVNIEKVNSLDLLTYFHLSREPDERTVFNLLSYIALLLGILLGILIMRPLVVEDMLLTREERIASATSLIKFNQTYGENQIDAKDLYTEFLATYDPFRIELFRIDIDKTVEIIFLHSSPNLTYFTLDSLLNSTLNKGATVTVGEDILYIYQLGGKFYVD